MTLEVRSTQAELMDADDLDTATYAVVLRDLAGVNRITLAVRPTIAFLRRVTKAGTHLRLLDVGYGDGDALRTICRWCRQRGIEAELVGIDINPRSARAATARTDPSLPIRYLTGDYRDLDGPWDVVISSLVAHHMSYHELRDFVRWMELNAEHWFINDLLRHQVAYFAYPWLAKIAGWHPIVQHDGKLSIARSFRPHEWPPILKDAGVAAYNVFKAFPFRLCVQGGAGMR